MPRKFRLYKCKYFAKLRRQDGEQKLKISLPITIYLNKTIKNLQELHERVNVLGIPTGWNKLDHEESLVLARLYSSLGNAQAVVILVTIDQSLHLTIQFDGHKLNLDEFQIQNKVNSFRQLNSVLSQIKGYCVCQGNLIEDFADVLTEETPTTTIMGKIQEII